MLGLSRWEWTQLCLGQGRDVLPVLGPRPQTEFHLGNRSCADLSVPDALPAPSMRFTPLWFHMDWIKPRPLWLCPRSQGLQGFSSMDAVGGAGHRCVHKPQLCPDSGLSAFPLSQPSSAAGSAVSFAMNVISFLEKKRWLHQGLGLLLEFCPGNKRDLEGVEGCNQSFTLSVPLPTAPEYKGLSWWGLTSGTHLLSISSPT